MAANINDKVFDEKTQLKLDIFRECFREWFPVFLHNPFINRIYIMDMFAGSGTDSEGNPGSPLVLLDEVKGVGANYCKHAEHNKSDVHFWFNELPSKKVGLHKNVESFIDECEEKCSLQQCYFRDRIKITEERFEDIFWSEAFNRIASRKDLGKFLLLDQYGFRQVGDNVFKKLIEYPTLDFIFFISSQAVRRFKEHEYVTRHIDSSKIEFDENAKLTHRQMADHYRELIPSGKEYYIHHFSILKGPNRYGLIFGTGHTYGMEKFLNVCWRKDKYAGESDELINNDWTDGTLFANTELPTKKREVKEDIQHKILEGVIKDNREGLKYALRQGCLGDVYYDAFKELKDREKITIEGKFNRKKTAIHEIKDNDLLYKIKVIGK